MYLSQSPGTLGQRERHTTAETAIDQMFTSGGIQFSTCGPKAIGRSRGKMAMVVGVWGEGGFPAQSQPGPPKGPRFVRRRGAAKQVARNHTPPVLENKLFSRASSQRGEY